MIDISSHLFRNRSPVAHAGVLVAGLAIGVGSYVLVVGALGGKGR